VEFGVGLPTTGPLATPMNIVRVAREAERLGYAAVWVGERLLFPVEPVLMPVRPPQPMPPEYRLMYEPLETLSHVAAHTERIRLGTSVVNALLHSPVVLARRFATLDQFSGGRVIAGLGQGWMRQEFETTNVPMEWIGAGMDEAVAVMRAVWGPDPVAYAGRYYRIAPSRVNPKPVQDRIPILLGSTTQAGARRAARIADGLNPVAFSAEHLRGLLAGFFQATSAAGRREQVRVVVRANVPITSEPLGQPRPYLGGSPRQIAQDLAGLAGCGVDHVLFSNRHTDDIDEYLRLLDRLQVQASGVTA